MTELSFVAVYCHCYVNVDYLGMNVWS